jgi:hypothetical protein
MTASSSRTYRSAPGGRHPDQWVVVENRPAASVIRFYDTREEADREVDRLNREGRSAPHY